jgi:hypothetical protein
MSARDELAQLLSASLFERDVWIPEWPADEAKLYHSFNKYSDTEKEKRHNAVRALRFQKAADAVLARFAVVELPEEHFAGDYALAHIEGDEIHIDVCWIDSADDARKVAAALLRAADQLEKQLAEERGPDGGEVEVDWGARADDARDAQVDRENGVTP